MAQNQPWGATPFKVTSINGTSQTVVVTGRDRWALECLIAAGERGCTPIDTPGPRWSAYVHSLREMGVEIETIIETHSGPFKGHHARYVLRSKVQRIEGEAA